MGTTHGAIRRALGRPAVAVVFGVALLVDVVCVYGRSEPKLGYRSVLSPLQMVRVCVLYDDAVGISVGDVGQAMMFVSGRDDAYHATIREAHMDDTPYVVLVHTFRVEDSGFWGHSKTNRRDMLLISSALPRALTSDEEVRLRRRFLDEHPRMDERLSSRADSEGVVADLVAAGVHNHVSYRPLGFVHDALGMLLLCFTPLSLVCTVRDARERRLLARDRCPVCKYDIRGLSRGVCPECGRGLSDG